MLPKYAVKFARELFQFAQVAEGDKRAHTMMMIIWIA